MSELGAAMKLNEAEVGKHVRDFAGTVYKVVGVDAEGPQGSGKQVTLQDIHDMHNRVVCDAETITRFRQLKGQRFQRPAP